MNIIQCIIADDEPLARSILERYINDHPLLALAAICGNAFETQAALNKFPCDLLFIDINMPTVSGISFVKSLTTPPTIIFTTAYPEFAAEGFELNAADYLVKPFSFDRFMKAVNKSMLQLRMSVNDINLESTRYLFFKVDKKLKKVNVADILYLEATGDYVKLFLKKEMVLINDTLKNLADELPVKLFVRVHKSYIISLDHLQFVEGNYARIGEIDIPIGATYKETFISMLHDQKRKSNR
jgi:two-component system LytT family response regulator